MSVSKVGDKYIARGKITLADGSRKDYKRQFDRKQDAIEFDTDYKRLHRNLIVQSKTITFKELADLYLEKNKNKKKISTITTDKYALDVINKKIGDKRIGTLNRNNLSKLFDEFDQEGLKQNTIDRRYYCVQKILSFAKKEGYIDYNPMLDVDKIKKLDEVTEEDAVHNCWTLNEYKDFIKYVSEPMYRDCFEFLFYMGVRKGEVMGLTWKNVDIKNKTVRIVQQINQHAGGIITSPKTKNSIRTIMMPNVVLKTIKKRLDNAKKEVGFKDTWFVFGFDQPLTRNLLPKRLDKYIEKANVKRITLHGFRHSHASLLINNGSNILAIANRLGDTVETVLETYAHLFKSTELELIKAIDQL